MCARLSPLGWARCCIFRQPMTCRHPCILLNCNRPGSNSYSQLCDTHRRRMARHGDPLQATLQAQLLQPYRRAVERLMSKHPQAQVWTILRERWEALAAHHKAYADAAAAGLAYNVHALEAAEQFTRLAGHAKPNTVIATALAMYAMREREPRRFASDRGFNFQLTLRVRNLCPADIGLYWDHKTQRMKRAFKDRKPRTTELVAAGLVEAFGMAGLDLAPRFLAELDAPKTKALADRDRWSAAVAELGTDALRDA